MSSRDLILSRLRDVRPTPRPLPDVPLFDTALPPAVDTFRASLARLGGTWCAMPENTSLDAFVRSRFPGASVFCSATPEFDGNRDLATIDDPRALNDVDVGIVRPAFAVAETGSIWLSEAQYGVNALGYLSQHLVALLDPADIVGNLHNAYHRSEFFAANYAVLMSGPSATADIEGVLVRGAQGIRSLTVIPLPRPVGDR
ncbi:hypothetical protein WS98_12920 [Burkholderia territorii]|uniref:LutC/YkgG family protein n=1 Tax=Burkholderia territorii TaxID=1503055 RepID=UPI00075AEB6D|nr:LUD domain-containing protein [Burkholderia territorii]AOI67890.1 hypothetical protein WS51_30085 [Burkholderia territorii]KUZ33942.1 hypothetical protein WS52_17915 [Burkholderia territorii]KUZ46623.1 hypothetical protein WS53_26295 [Burkholderia territorii]KVG53717.1 hypothetical protein WS79_28940 [Burkholderia territorii]KVL35530.1 hypothetical protein WS97_14485 [Burkholderia territorii]